MLHNWPGLVGRSNALHILCYVPLVSFDGSGPSLIQSNKNQLTRVPELRSLIFEPLLAAMVPHEGAVMAEHLLVQVYTNVLRHWLDLVKVSDRPIAQARASLIGLTNHVNTLAMSLTQPGTNTQTSVSEAAIHFGILSYFSLLSSALKDPKLQPYIHIMMPPGPLVYRLFFSPSVAVVSAMCNILASYKKAFEKVMVRPFSESPQNLSPLSQQQGGKGAGRGAVASTPSQPVLFSQQMQSSQDEGEAVPAGGRGRERGREGHRRRSSWQALPPARPHQYDADYVMTFNSYLMDCCNCLWRGRAFNITDANSQGCRIDRNYVHALESYVASLDRRGVTLQSLFTLPLNPITALEAILFVREKEMAEEEKEGGGGDGEAAGVAVRHAGPVSAESLRKLAKDGGMDISWQDYRLGVLERLESRGIDGIAFIMFNTMKNLMGTRK